MAARKSCTHLTWAEAKAKVGEGSGKKKADGGATKKLSHVEKMIAKNAPSAKDQRQYKTSMRKQHRQEERAANAAKRRAEERQKQREEESIIKPYEEALKKIEEVAIATSENAPDYVTTESIPLQNETLSDVVQCKEMQLDELVALEAMYSEEGVFRVCNSSQLDELRQKVEDWQMDDENESLMQAIAGHAPISFTLKLRIEHCCVEDDSLVALLLVRVLLPSRYPLRGGAPDFEIVWFMVADPEQTCSSDKPLESLAYCDAVRLKEAIRREAEEQLLPDPCVYELATTWLSEHLRDYVTVSVRARK